MCKTVPKQECFPSTERRCQPVAKPHCTKVPRAVARKQCRPVEKEHCEDVPGEVCQGNKGPATVTEDTYNLDVPTQECRPVTTEKCQDLPQTHCVGKTIHTTMRESCLRLICDCRSFPGGLFPPGVLCGCSPGAVRLSAQTGL